MTFSRCLAVNQAYLHKHNEPLFVEKLVIKIILLFNGQYSQQHCLFEIIYDIHSYYDAFRFIYSRKVCTMYHVKGINKPILSLFYVTRVISFCSLSGPLATPRIIYRLVLLWTCITPSFNNAQTRQEGTYFQQTSFFGKTCQHSRSVRLDVLLMGKMFLEFVKMVDGRVPSVVSNTSMKRPFYSKHYKPKKCMTFEITSISIVYRRKPK